MPVVGRKIKNILPVQILLKVDQLDRRGCKLHTYSHGYSVCC